MNEDTDITFHWHNCICNSETDPTILSVETEANTGELSQMKIVSEVILTEVIQTGYLNNTFSVFVF